MPGPAGDGAGSAPSSATGDARRAAWSTAARSKASPGSLSATPPGAGVPATGPAACCTVWAASCASSRMPSVESGIVGAGAEVDVPAGGEGLRFHGAAEAVRLRVGVHPHARQVGAEAVLEPALHPRLERLPGAAAAQAGAEVRLAGRLPRAGPAPQEALDGAVPVGLLEPQQLRRAIGPVAPPPPGGRPAAAPGTVSGRRGQPGRGVLGVLRPLGPRDGTDGTGRGFCIVSPVAAAGASFTVVDLPAGVPASARLFHQSRPPALPWLRHFRHVSASPPRSTCRHAPPPR